MKVNRRVVAIVVPAGIILCAGWMAWSNSALGNGGARIDAELAALKSYGVPTTPAELRVGLSKLSGSNAAPTYLRAISAYRSISPSTLTKAMNLALVAPQRPLSAAEISEFKTVESSLDPTFSLLVAASNCDLLDYGRNWDQGIFLLFPDLAPFRNLAELCAVGGYARIRMGDMAGARSLFLASASMARRLGDDPTVLAATIRAGTEICLLRILMRCLEFAPADVRVRDILREVLAKLGPPIDLRPAIAGKSSSPTA